MPIYEFRCRSCGSVQEAILPLGSAGEGLKCQACDTEAMEKVFSTFAASGSSKTPSSCGGGGFT